MLSKTNQYPTRALATASHLKAAPIPSASPEQRIAALEQQVAQMQQYIQQLLAVITVESNGQKLKLKAPTIEVDALVDVKLKAGAHITMDCQHDLVARGPEARWESMLHEGDDHRSRGGCYRCNIACHGVHRGS